MDVVDRGKNVGDFVLDAYLPGDVNGDGTVTQADVKQIQAAYGTRKGQARFDPAADVNLDGRVGCFDRALAEANLGAHAAVVAEWMATPTPAPVTPAVQTPTPTPKPHANPHAHADANPHADSGCGRDPGPDRAGGRDPRRPGDARRDRRRPS